MGSHAADFAVTLFFIEIYGVFQTAAAVVAIKRDARILIAALFGQIAVRCFIALDFTDGECVYIEVLQLACVIGFLFGVTRGNIGIILFIHLEIARFQSDDFAVYLDFLGVVVRRYFIGFQKAGIEFVAFFQGLLFTVGRQLQRTVFRDGFVQFNGQHAFRMRIERLGHGIRQAACCATAGSQHQRQGSSQSRNAEGSHHFFLSFFIWYDIYHIPKKMNNK